MFAALPELRDTPATAIRFCARKSAVASFSVAKLYAPEERRQCDRLRLHSRQRKQAGRPQRKEGEVSPLSGRRAYPALLMGFSVEFFFHNIAFWSRRRPITSVFCSSSLRNA